MVYSALIKWQKSIIKQVLKSTLYSLDQLMICLFPRPVSQGMNAVNSISEFNMHLARNQHQLHYFHIRIISTFFVVIRFCNKMRL